jgi:thiol-disulfide isomerase/thioredoxin
MSSSQITNLSSDDFSGLLLKNHYKDKIVLIKFYVGWCGYCQKIQPLFKFLDQYFKNDKRIVITEYDCEDPENKDFIHNSINKFNYGFKVNGYPTLIIYKNGLFNQVYNGNRNAKEIINTLNNLKKNN